MNRALIRDMGYKKVFIKEVSSIIYDSSMVGVSKGEMGKVILEDFRPFWIPITVRLIKR